MITYNKKQINEFILKGFFDEEKKDFKNPLIIKEEGVFSIISETRTIWLSLGKKIKFDIEKLIELLCPVLFKNKYDLDIDISTFISKNLNSFKIFEKLLDCFYYLRHEMISHKEKPKKILKNKINLLINEDEKKLKEILILTKEKLLSVNFARDLQDQAPNIMTPEFFTNLIVKKIKGIENLKIKILNKKEILEEKMNLLLSVNSGSLKEPRVIVMKYMGNSKIKKITGLVGKGITFDSGGYSLKPSQHQIDMKFDMSGAAIVCSAIIAIAKLKLPVNVISVVCLTENLIGSSATLVESVIKSKSGITVEITNTDAEGRLVLADGITYIKENLKVDEIIELSTLTGAISYTLGDYMSGLFSNNDKLSEKFISASKITDEEVWRLPVHKTNFKYMKESVIADLLNSSKEYKGSSSNAAAFLFSFAKKTPFIHLDIAGTADKNHRGTGVMVRTLIQFFKN